MATSGTSAFNLDITEIVEEASDRAGVEMRSGYDLASARRSINLMMLDWQNRGINLWTVEEGTQALTSGTASYNLPSGTIDLVDSVLRSGTGTSQSDYPIRRISFSQYASQTNKNTQGRPLQMMVSRTTSPSVTLWPVPDTSDYTFVYWRLRRVEDTGTNGANTMDMPERFLPALISGLAYHLAVKAKSPESNARAPALKGLYEEDYMMAADEDRDRAAVFLRPHVSAL